MNDQFSLKQFYQKLHIPKDERPLIEEMMAKGLEKYYRVSRPVLSRCGCASTR